jgi:hypothetical protein
MSVLGGFGGGYGAGYGAGFGAGYGAVGAPLLGSVNALPVMQQPVRCLYCFQGRWVAV